MTKITYTLHAQEKFKRKDIKKLKINKQKVKNVLSTSNIIYAGKESLVVIGKLDNEFSLCVAFKMIDTGTKVITFFPARKGRYESKIQ